jgi:hypothetical protein
MGDSNSYKNLAYDMRNFTCFEMKKIVIVLSMVFYVACIAWADDLAPFGAYANGTNAAWFDSGSGTYVFRFSGGNETIQYHLPLSRLRTGLLTVYEWRGHLP